MNERRKFLKTFSMFSAVTALLPNLLLANQTKIFRVKRNEYDYYIGVCDWMLLKRQKLGVFKLAAEIGADGVEIDMGPLGDRPTFDNKLLDPIVRNNFINEARKYNLKICSIAMSGFYSQSFLTRENYEILFRDTINTMNLLNVKIAFLPFGVQNDLVKFPELRPQIIERLKQIARMAEAGNVVIGIETSLDAIDESKLIDEINSPSIKSYFNFANALQNNRNLLKEIKTLGKDRICQIHCTDQDGFLLKDNPRLNLFEVKELLYKINWKGWLVVERSRDASRVKDVVYNFGSNVKYLKEIFQ